MFFFATCFRQFMIFCAKFYFSAQMATMAIGNANPDIATNLFIKFQGSSCNSFLDILLTRETCPNLQRAITYKIFFRIYKKVNQVIYSSLPIISPSFKSLALTVFFRYFADKIKMPKITKGHNSISIFKIYSKVNQVVYSSLQIHSPYFMALALTVFEIFCWQGKNAQNHKGP